MVKQVSTSEDTQTNISSDIPTQIHVAASQKRTPRGSKTNRTAQVVQVTERHFEEDIPATGQHDTEDTEFEELDDEAREILNFESAFSEFGEGGYSLLVYGLPDTNPRGFNRLGWEFIDTYAFDPLNWLIDLRENFPEGGRFQLHLRDARGIIRKRKTVTLAKKRQSAGIGVSAPEKSNSGQPDAKSQNPVEMMRASLEPAQAMFAMMKDFGFGPPQPPPPPVEDEFTKAAKNLLLKRLEREDEPQRQNDGERPTSWGDVVIEFIHSNEGMGTHLADLVKTILPKIILPNIQTHPAPQTPQHDATGEVVHETIDAGAIEAEATVIDPPPTKPTWEQAAAQSLAIAIDAILNSKPVTLTAQYITGLAIDYPDAPVNYKVLIPLAPPDQVLALLIEQADAETQNKLQHTPEAPQWIKQLQAELKK